MPSADDLMSHNRVLLAHFDGYSAALHFAKWDASLMAPSPLPADAQPMPAPDDASVAHDPVAVRQAMANTLAVKDSELEAVAGFNHWFQTDKGPVRVHLLRFTTFEPPRTAIEARGGVFKAISELRGSAALELPLVREVFNLLVGGGGRA